MAAGGYTLPAPQAISTLPDNIVFVATIQRPDNPALIVPIHDQIRTSFRARFGDKTTKCYIDYRLSPKPSMSTGWVNYLYTVWYDRTAGFAAPSNDDISWVRATLC